jgi:3-hydroxybutyryl-CoA dehydrogenase
MRHIGVVGCGTMGAGIVEVILQNKYRVTVKEENEVFLEKGLTRIQRDFEKLIQKGKLTLHDKETLTGNLFGTISLDDLAECDLVIEAVPENNQLKKDLFTVLDKTCKAETIFASNTSSLSVTEMAGFTARPERFVGLHFFNPATIMPLVEVIKTLATPAAILESVLTFIKSLDKTPIVAKDNAGFIVNLFLTPFLMDAMRGVGEGVALVQDIDLGMKLGCNHPMGPLMLADFIGLDVLCAGATRMHEEYNDRRYAPPPILKKLVLMGNLGQKTGKGFYDWSDVKNPVPRNLGS